MKNRVKSLLFLVSVALILANCSRDFENPYDRECPPGVWTPQNFIAYADTVNNNVELSWDQPSNSLFDGYIVERTTDSIDWKRIPEGMEDPIEYDELSFDDDDVDLGDTLIIYRIKGVADLNETEWVFSNRVGMPPLFFELTLLPEPDAGGNVDGSGSYEATEEVDIEADPETGYHFLQWICQTDGDNPDFLDDPHSASTVLTMPGRDVILEAHFEQTEYELILEDDPQGAAEVLDGDGTYFFGDAVTISTEPNDGYIFIEWTDENGQVLSTSESHQFNMPADHLTLTANFSEFSEEDWECGEDFEFRYMDEHVVYGTIEKHGICWMNRNLGAEAVPDDPEDAEGFGHLFQWGRLADGHQYRNSETTTQISNEIDPGHSMFIEYAGDAFPFDWLLPQNNDLWQADNDPIINNPCPPGWRVPSNAELNDEVSSWNTTNSEGAFDSTLRWPLSGFRGLDGDVIETGTGGRVWSRSFSDESDKSSWYGSLGLFYDSEDAEIQNLRRAMGYSVRCVRDLP